MKIMIVVSLILYVVSALEQDPIGKPDFKVCGNFCGPTWCAAEVIAESDCVAEGVWGTVPSESGSCADACCRLHDRCCGEGTDRPACNQAIVQCIQDNSCYTSVCGAAVWLAMKTVENWCCGSACPTELMAELEKNMTLRWGQHLP
eukprot:TRINITY_DN2278_c0_g2_i1.p1 TRINITY_DN2278_c0_g2~~TRINITY_DN2278_c0_g2_i1.p1  ORF type:complete len:146 (-),score=26.01 TRINITY_DN2278_c0_g2_i1:132-569(-)